MREGWRAVDVIAKKRDGCELSADDIHALVDAYVRGDVANYQMSAWLMAVYLRGMSVNETIELTRAMIASGETVQFPSITRFTADKHSTGGVGDKTTLVLAPILASLGVVVPKLSGRGLGHTGGTLDKLDSIPGFRTHIAIEEFQRIANDVGMVVAGATANLVPADQKLYALRDVTATVACLPLIASSIMSKKLAVQTDSLVIDVKVGDGAFFPIPEQAREFARVAGAIGRVFGRRVSFVLTDMDQPLGEAIGNALEVREAIETLKGGGPAALMEVCAALAAQVLADAGFSEGIAGLVTETIRDGRALEVFERWISAQGGDARIVDDPARLPQAKHQIRVRAPHGGTIDSLRARQLGELAEKLGAGRTRKEDTIDPAAGILLRIKAPCVVNAGDDLAVLHTDSEPRDEWRELFLAAVHWTSDSPTRRATVLDVIRT